MATINYSLIIPIYKNELNIADLLIVLRTIFNKLDDDLEVVFVVDGSPDKSYEILKNSLPLELFSSQLILLSKNFGAFSAIRSGLKAATGKYFTIMSADLQEPPELILKIFKLLLRKSIDIAIGVRASRNDPIFSKIFSNIFWFLYKKFVVKDMPVGGVDIFGCNEAFKKQLLRLNESHSSLIAHIFWLGHRRELITYERLNRAHGKSSWTFTKKINYMMDSIFSFTDIPIRMLTRIGAIGIIVFGISGIITFVSKLLGLITIPGYTSIFLVIGFFSAINLFGLGIIGSYTWRTYENTKARPLSITLSIEKFN